MKTTAAILTFLLCLSVTVNILFWRELVGRNPNPDTVSPKTEEGTEAAAFPFPHAPESQSILPEADAQQSPKVMFARLHQWLQTGEYDRLEQALSAQLRAQPQNEELLLLEAELIARTQPLSYAVVHYYMLLELPLSPNTLQDVRERIDNLTTTAIAQLRQDMAWDLLARFLEPLFQLLPDNRTYILTLAEAYAQQQKTTLMEDVLAALPYNDAQAQAIRAKAYPAEKNQPEPTSSAQPQTASADEIRLPLRREGDQFVAYITIGERATSLLLDTGASTTAVSADVIEQLRQRQKIRFVGIFDVSTAAGTIQSPMVQVPLLQIGPYRFTDVSVMVMPVTSLPHAEGLLGMNILKAFDFRIDQMNNELVLRQH